MTGVEPAGPGCERRCCVPSRRATRRYTAQGFVEYTVYLFASVEDAQAQYAAEVAANEAWYDARWEDARESDGAVSTSVQIFIQGLGPLDDYDVVGVCWIAIPAIRVADDYHGRSCSMASPPTPLRSDTDRCVPTGLANRTGS